MGGPIVRTGTTPKFWKNWDNIFGDKKKDAGKKSSTAAKKKAATSSKKKSGKKKSVKRG